jgi:hypothetical protein
MKAKMRPKNKTPSIIPTFDELPCLWPDRFWGVGTGTGVGDAGFGLVGVGVGAAGVGGAGVGETGVGCDGVGCLGTGLGVGGFVGGGVGVAGTGVGAAGVGGGTGWEQEAPKPRWTKADASAVV